MTQRINLRVLPVFCVLILALHLGLAAQYAPCPPIPDSGRWRVASDYAQSKDSVEKLILWLCKTPLGVFVKERSESNACVMIWLAGSPEIRMEIETGLIPFFPENEELLYPFIHGWAAYALAHPKETDRLKFYTRGFETVASLAAQSELLSREKYLRPLLRAHRKGNMREYTEEILSGERTH